MRVTGREFPEARDGVTRHRADESRQTVSDLSRVREFNRGLNDRFFPRNKARYVDRFRQLTDELSARADLVLHLGSGRVDLATNLRSRSPKLRLLNLDRSHQWLWENPGRLKVCGDAEALPLPSRCVDLIVSEHVFEHLRRPLACLQECFRVLKSNGKLVVSGPNGRSYIALAARLTPLGFHHRIRRLQIGWNGSEADGFPTFYRFSTPRAMSRLAKKAGFDVVDVETFVGEPCYTTFLPLLHVAFVAYHLLLEKLRPVFGFHITSVAVFRKPGERKGQTGRR